MIWSNAKLSPDARLLLDRERVITVLPSTKRARALVRARAALAAGVATRPNLSRAPFAARWAAAVGLACLATAAAVAAAYQVGLRARPTTPPVVAPPPGGPPRTLVSPAAASTLAEATVSATALAPSRVSAVRDELHLLQKARAAVAREDFVAATLLLAEHARRFKTGRFAEEREALRVRSLVGLGHRDHARRAAADFEARFPSSPLLATVSQMPDSAP